VNSTPAPVLATHGLTRRFGSLAVVDDVSIALPVGARYAVIGPNGAGKTTLLNLIAGTLEPDAGSVLLDGADVTPLRPDERARRGLSRTFQMTSLFPHLVPLEAVTLAVGERRGLSGGIWRGVAAYPEAVAEAYQILQSLGLAGECTRPTRTLSYGRQRLLDIAVALAASPKVLLLDEPVGGVGQRERATILDCLERLPAHVSVLFVEHDMNVVFRFARSVVVMVAGKVLTEGSPAEVTADPAVREVYLGSRRYG
jgi:branched-chain amino acid transport system ATP-binding protein